VKRGGGGGGLGGTGGIGGTGGRGTVGSIWLGAKGPSSAELVVLGASRCRECGWGAGTLVLQGCLGASRGGGLAISGSGGSSIGRIGEPSGNIQTFLGGLGSECWVDWHTKGGGEGFGCFHGCQGTPGGWRSLFLFFFFSLGG